MLVTFLDAAFSIKLKYKYALHLLMKDLCNLYHCLVSLKVNGLRKLIPEAEFGEENDHVNNITTN